MQQISFGVKKILFCASKHSQFVILKAKRSQKTSRIHTTSNLCQWMSVKVAYFPIVVELWSFPKVYQQRAEWSKHLWSKKKKKKGSNWLLTGMAIFSTANLKLQPWVKLLTTEKDFYFDVPSYIDVSVFLVCIHWMNFPSLDSWIQWLNAN